MTVPVPLNAFDDAHEVRRRWGLPLDHDKMVGIAITIDRDSFLARLLAQLNRFKQYPRAARQAHIEGVVMLHFVMDAQGRVLQSEIARSSGRPVLDNEALALISRAQPLPPLPADFPTSILDAVVPIEFSLNG